MCLSVQANELVYPEFGTVALYPSMHKPICVTQASEYGSIHRPYVVPDTTLQELVMLPQKHVKWLSSQPESVLSLEAVRHERNGVKYLPTSLDPKSTLLFIDKIIGQSLSQSLDLIQSDMYDEIRHVVDATLGIDGSTWREVNLNEALSRIIEGTGNRVLFGLSLCRNATYLLLLRVFIISMGISTLVIGQLPPWVLRPVVGVSLSVPTFIFKKLCMSYVQPLVKRRLQTVQDSASEKEVGSEGKSQDFVTQSIKSVKKFKNSIEGDVSTYLTEQFLILAFAGIATTSAAATNILLDILSAGPDLNLYETLRIEAKSVLHLENDWIAPASMKKLVIIDSTIRESLRKNTLQSRVLLKKVMPKDGVVLPDGTHVPRGTWLGVPVQAMQQDDNLYQNAQHYDPLRFVRMREQVNRANVAEVSGGEGKDLLDAAQPSDKYLSFSYGRSACPGRWFAARLLKLMIAYIVLHYDIKPLGHRPENISFGDASIPSFTTTIMNSQQGHKPSQYTPIF
ncbi:cytochrome P450 [Coniochaeta sp. 2T2.1]|nr:cytochrome P450 [Coniochaeta sp. 2T2.1]